VSPAFSFSNRSLGLNVIFVVTINSSAGNFCKRTLGASHKFFALSGNLSENNLRDPFAEFAKAHVASGLATHCHCNPILLLLNSSDSCGEEIPKVFPTPGFL